MAWVVRGVQSDKSREQVSFQWKNPDFLLRNPDFLLRNVDFLIKQPAARDGHCFV